MTSSGPVVRVVRSPTRGGFEIVGHRYRCVDGSGEEKVKSEWMPPLSLCLFLATMRASVLGSSYGEFC